MYDCFVFDLDGTLLHTLPDLADSTNAVLRQMGYPQRSEEQILHYIGDGARRLLYQAVPATATREDAERALQLWQQLYPQQGYPKTKPFDGIEETLAELKARGIRLGVLSNKFDKPAKENIARFLPGIFDVVYGERLGIPRKPDPTALCALIEELGSVPERTVYVGDSAADMQVAHNAGAFALGVSWGYNQVSALQAAGADMVAQHPAQMIDLIEG